VAGNILHQGALVLCKHPPGSASPDQADPRVSVSGQPIMTVARRYTVIGCALNGTTSPPCTTAAWLTGAERVLASGLPVAIPSGQSLCMPSAAILDPKTFQQRVTAS
jgi:hypothetical protein